MVVLGLQRNPNDSKQVAASSVIHGTNVAEQDRGASVAYEGSSALLRDMEAPRIRELRNI